VVLAIDGVSRRFGAQRVGHAAMCIVIACLAVRTYARNADWQDQRSILTAGLEVSPQSYKLHKQMAAVLFGSERTPENIHRGKAEAEQSIAILDSLPDAQNTAEPFCLAGEYQFLDAELQNGSGALSLSPAIAEYRRGIDFVRRCAKIDKAVHDAYLKKKGSVSSDGRRRMTPPPGDPQPFLMLSAAYLRLSDGNSALEAARNALRLHPRSAAGYRQIANVFVLRNQREDAAIALTEGTLLTSDPGLMENIETIYMEDPAANQCKVVQTSSGPAIDSLCTPYRRHACALWSEVMDTLIQAGRDDLAEQKGRELRQAYGCSSAQPDPLSQRGR
jgi:tetratricopeptide (TPR) repeat protein